MSYFFGWFGGTSATTAPEDSATGTTTDPSSSSQMGHHQHSWILLTAENGEQYPSSSRNLVTGTHDATADATTIAGDTDAAIASSPKPSGPTIGSVTRGEVAARWQIGLEEWDGRKVLEKEAFRIAKAVDEVIKAEAERVAKEKAEAERIAKEKAEAERIAKEKAEAERIAKEKAEAERIAKAEDEAEAKAAADRLVADRAFAESLVEGDRRDRLCDCLGAGADYHQPECKYFK